MLPKKYRLKRGRDFELILKRGRRERLRSWFGLKHLGSNRHHPRLAVVIKKATTSLAVKRNQLRRKVVGILEDETKRSNKGLDMVIFIYKEPGKQDDWNFLLKAVNKIIR